MVSNLATVRSQYIEASKSKQKADSFLALVSKEKNSPIFNAYKGAAIALQAKFSTDRKKRKELFIEGVTLLEKSIKDDANNLEIKLIRLSIQENTPKILNYKMNIKEDKSFIIANFDKQDKDLQTFVKNYINQSNSFSDSERAALLK